MSKITSIATAVPTYGQSQMQIYNVVRAIHADTAEEERVLRFMYKSSGIETRYAAVPDFNLGNGRSEILHFEENGVNTSGLEERLKIYDKAALDLSIDVIRKCLPEGMEPSGITHLITVSCTGMQAPGLDLSIVKGLKLRTDIYRTSVNFMGCYAAIHGLKHAHYIAEKESDAKVLVVCVELCTLHFQKDKSIDNITSTIIFGDGAAAVLIENSAGKRPGWELKNFYSEINFEGMDDMAWKISADGFLMTLTSKVPEILEKKCKGIMENALQYYGIPSERVDSWCVHPGGKKILEAVERGSSVTREQLQESYAVLREYGNMSSPTVLFVLEKILRKAEQDGSVKNIVGMAFGPGLTLETFHLAHA
ncbi:type III polyketide synthase [Niabella yanshanensis]|uniref:Type III polyketide synthase n=1 Tax=Niabella yanshanensis TaxID=577386 RepID=A0ABZ0W317_9BACT|nr:type III polyketide synthase [Niabella yanshanensis]WQD37653.1 type III polyketide synthase [Niabella yanshanensis]